MQPHSSMLIDTNDNIQTSPLILKVKRQELWRHFWTHLCWYGAGDGEVDVNVHLGGRVLEVDAGQMFVVGFAQVKRKLVVDSQLIWKRISS